MSNPFKTKFLKQLLLVQRYVKSKLCSFKATLMCIVLECLYCKDRDIATGIAKIHD